jgi:hypothetical protein
MATMLATCPVKASGSERRQHHLDVTDCDVRISNSLAINLKSQFATSNAAGSKFVVASVTKPMAEQVPHRRASQQPGHAQAAHGARKATENPENEEIRFKMADSQRRMVIACYE